MIYLLLAIACSVMISITMRVSKKYVENEMGMFMTNYAICTVLSLLYMPDKSQIMSLVTKEGSLTMVLGAIGGILYLVSFLFMKINMDRNGVVMSSIFMKLGILVPTIMAVVVFHEVPRWTQIAGVLVAVFAIILINFEKDALTESKNKFYLLLLLLLGGFAEAMANIYDKIGDATLKDGFLFATFGTAFVVAVSLAIMSRKKVSVKEILFGVLIGTPNYFFSRFLLLALESIPAVLIYPTYCVSSIIIITLIGMIAFHEKVSKQKMCALGLILFALVLLNI